MTESPGWHETSLIELELAASEELECCVSELEASSLLELSGLAVSELDEAGVSLELDGVTFELLLWYSGGVPYRHCASVDVESSQLAQKRAVVVRRKFFQCLRMFMRNSFCSKPKPQLFIDHLCWGRL